MAFYNGRNHSRHPGGPRGTRGDPKHQAAEGRRGRKIKWTFAGLNAPFQNKICQKNIIFEIYLVRPTKKIKKKEKRKEKEKRERKGRGKKKREGDHCLE